MVVPELPVPYPTEEYLAQAALPPIPLPPGTPAQPLLVILDLNGTLLFRSVNKKNHATSRNPVVRPYLPFFLHYLFSNFNVMVWSSAHPDNVRAMVRAIMLEHQQDKLCAIWARDTLGLNKLQMRSKLIVYKTLEPVWEKIGISNPTREDRHLRPWSQRNTILIDDSSVKATAQPYNLVEVSTWENPMKQQADKELVSVAGYLEELRTGNWSDVSSYMRAHPFSSGDKWAAKCQEWFWGPSGKFFWKVIGNPYKKRLAADKMLKKQQEAWQEHGVEKVLDGTIVPFQAKEEYTKGPR